MSDYSNAQEYRVRDLCRAAFPSIPGIERVPLSGASALVKGDIADRNGMLPVFIDHKSTIGRGSISVKLEDIEKVLEQGKDKKFHALTFGYKRHEMLFAAVPLDEYLELLSHWYYMMKKR